MGIPGSDFKGVRRSDALQRKLTAPAKQLLGAGAEAFGRPAEPDLLASARELDQKLRDHGRVVMFQQ